jgi:hypothetical protein
LRDVSSDYFRTLGAKLVRGRYFKESDGPGTPGVAIINRAFARRYFPGEDPIGKKIGDTKLSPASNRNAVFQARYPEQVVTTPPLLTLPGRVQGGPELGWLGGRKMERGRQNANDDGRVTVQPDRLF